MAVRELRVESPSTEEILAQIAEIIMGTRQHLVLQAVEVGNELARRRSPVVETFTLELASLEFPTSRLTFMAQDTTTKEWCTVSQLTDGSLQVQVVA